MSAGLGGVLFSGTLQPADAPGAGLAPSAVRRGLPAGSQGWTEAAAGGRDGGGGGAHAGLLPAASGISSDRHQGTPAGTGALSLAATGGVSGALRGPAAGGAGAQWFEGESRPDAGAERRAVADERYRQMEAEGAPAGTKCALCHGTDTGARCCRAAYLYACAHAHPAAGCRLGSGGGACCRLRTIRLSCHLMFGF